MIANTLQPKVDLKRLFDRLPPHSLEAEMALLGSMILDHAIIGDVTESVSASCFYKEAHAAIYEALTRVHDLHQSGDLVQLVEALRSSQQIDDVGGVDYLVRLAECVPSAANWSHYARIVASRAGLRAVAEAAGQTLHEAMNAGDLNAGDEEALTQVIDRAQQRMFDCGDLARRDRREIATLGELLGETMDELIRNEGRAITGIDTGFVDLSDALSGLQAGEMIVVAGRPSMGKTAFALNMAEQIAASGDADPSAPDCRVPVGVFSMEMSRSSLTQRLLCASANVDSHRFRTNRLNKEEFKTLQDTCGRLSHLPLVIDDSPALTIMQLRARARRMVSQYKVRCIIVDYLQLMSAPGKDRDGRQNEVSAISRGVKAIARELNIPVVCLSQLNRGAEARADNRPRMSDLRESGAIEQDADVILLLHREEYYHQADTQWLAENPDKRGTAEVIIAKQRNGPTATIDLTWDAPATRFRNLQRYSSGHIQRVADAQPKPAGIFTPRPAAPKSEALPI